MAPKDAPESGSHRAVVDGPAAVWRLALVGFGATLVGIGLARFAYTPLMPVLIEEAWVTESQAAYMGAANLTGYLLGAVTAWATVRRARTGTVVLANLALCALSMFACALSWGFGWLLAWRLVAGYGGAVLMVLAGPAILSQVPRERWGAASGTVYTGIGVGIALSGTLVPALAEAGAATAWVTLGAITALVTAYAWVFWREPPAASSDPVGMEVRRWPSWLTLPVALLAIAYALYAVGFVPHTIFWVDFLARGLGLGIQAGGGQWILFGLGAAAAPFCVGQLARRFGFGPLLPAALAVMGAAVLLPAFSAHLAALSLSSLLVGALIPGIVVLAAGRAGELTGRYAQRRVWWLMTVTFALTQAGASYGLSAMFDASRTYVPLFLLAGAVLLVGCLVAMPRLGEAPARRAAAPSSIARRRN